MKKFLIPILLFLGFCSGAHAQTVATVTGHEIFPSAGPSSNASVCFSLQNFKPNVPRITSTGIVVQQQNWCITPSPVDGSFSVPIVRNDAITPIGTFWRIDFLWNGLQQSSATYIINHTPFNLDVEVPLSQTPAAGPTQIITQAFSCPQFSASTTWVCTHNFNDLNVEVATYDLTNTRIFPNSVVATSANVVTITWVVPQSGLAVIFHAGSLSIATSQPNAVLQNPTGTQSICCFSLTISAPFASTNTATFSGVVVDNGTHTFNSSATFVGPVISPTIGPSSGQQHSLPAVTSDTIALLNASQTLINKIFNVDSNTLQSTTNTAGNVLRNNGTQYVGATLAASDLSNGVSGSGAVVLGTGPSLGSPNITTPVINGASSGTGVQGTDSKLLTAGTVGSSGTTLCADVNGGATTNSCTASEAIQNFSNTPLSGDVAVSANTQTTVTSKSLVMPSSGCPCRVYLSYTGWWNTASSGTGVAFWYSDGTNTFLQVSGGQSNGSSGAAASVSDSGFSTVTYANSANVTFTFLTQGTFAYTVKSAPITGSGPNSALQTSIVTSN